MGLRYRGVKRGYVRTTRLVDKGRPCNNVTPGSSPT